MFDGTSMGSDGGGDLFSQAVAIVKRDRKASTSYIQRRLQIGYNRAASLMERMELEGIVGQANHAGKREILIEEEEGQLLMHDRHGGWSRFGVAKSPQRRVSAYSAKVDTGFAIRIRASY